MDIKIMIKSLDKEPWVYLDDANDLKEWIRWYGAGSKSSKAPRLSKGWRSEVCGDLLRDVLEGNVSLRVADTNSDHPLVFERVDS